MTIKEILDVIEEALEKGDEGKGTGYLHNLLMNYVDRMFVYANYKPRDRVQKKLHTVGKVFLWRHGKEDTAIRMTYQEAKKEGIVKKELRRIVDRQISRFKDVKKAEDKKEEARKSVYDVPVTDETPEDILIEKEKELPAQLLKKRNEESARLAMQKFFGIDDEVQKRHEPEFQYLKRLKMNDPLWMLTMAVGEEKMLFLLKWFKGKTFRMPTTRNIKDAVLREEIKKKKRTTSYTQKRMAEEFHISEDKVRRLWIEEKKHLKYREKEQEYIDDANETLRMLTYECLLMLLKLQ